MIVPLFPSHFSALGMLLADERHDFIRTYYSDLAGVDFADCVKSTRRWRERRSASLRHTARRRSEQIQLDLRYVGQEFTLPVPVTLAQLKAGNRKRIRTAFDALYEHRYAHHSPDEPVEMVNMRLGVIGKRAKLRFPRARQGARDAAARHRDVYFADAASRCAARSIERDDAQGRRAHRRPGR